MCNARLSTWTDYDEDAGESGHDCAACDGWVPGHRRWCPTCGHDTLTDDPEAHAL